MFDLDEDIGQNDRGRERLRQSGGAEAKVIVFLIGIEKEHVRQALLVGEALEVAHVRIADARGAAANHVEAGDLVRLTLLADVEELADTDRQRQALAARGVLETALELPAVQRKHRAGAQAEPAD